MNTESKSIILAESSRIIGQIGNNIVLDLYARVREVEALTRTLGATIEHLPKSESLFKAIVPTLLNFQGDLSIAGGGVWHEPYLFSPDQARRSFFFGRNVEGKLEYFDDYNKPGSGYHYEAWYAVGRYAKTGQCVWSASYLDPYSHQPMITCTTPMFERGIFSGVVTVDLKLEGVQAFIEAWREKTGGYIFVLDRNNRFVTFPNPLLVKIKPDESEGHTAAEFMLAGEFAGKQPLFAPLAIAVESMNQAILQEAQRRSDDQLDVAKRLHTDSYQIDVSEADLIASILTDPLNVNDDSGEGNSTTHLYQQFEIECDFLLKEPATAFLFHVPRSYWKVVIVKPFSEAAMATYSIIQAEKMSSLGQLVAGVAHEVNNPINFIYGNLTYTNTYTQDLLAIVKLYQQYYPDPPPAIQHLLEDSDLSFVEADLPKLLASMQVGADRIRQLVLSLRNFAHIDEAAIKTVDVHEGLESTLMLLDSRLKRCPNEINIQICKNYAVLPPVECYPGPLNQVFMNILVNAIDALEESMSSNLRLSISGIQSHEGKQAVNVKQPTITIQTEQRGQSVAIRIADNGSGIPEGVQQRLFDPFFTTKPVGKGTGLGLAISYQIVTEKHHGQLKCQSTPGQGSEFYIEIPIQLEL
ncbi:MAG: hypothetical protein KME45_07770 [Stenomitos rutilans HA7619-LM2]|jgi:signal transduction histidine kinase|nr:hypothetical protein [Stenomitos rutilans HA7619-LM2]